MSAYSFLSAAAFAAYLGLGGAALALGPRDATNRVFAALAGAMAIWAFSFAFSAAVPTRDVWFVWYRATAPAWLLVPALSFHLCWSVTGRRLRPPLVAAAYGPAFLLAAYGATLTLGPELDFVRTDLGWVTDRSRVPTGVQAFFLYSVVAHVAGLVAVWRWGRRTAQRRERSQARLLVGSGAVTLVVGYALSLGLTGDGEGPPCMTHIVGLIWAGGVVVAIVRHRFMAITPAFAARQIIDSVGDALLLTDPDGRVVDLNGRALDALGRPRHELVGRPWDELTVEPAAARAAFATVRDGGRPTLALETALAGADGERRPVAITGTPVPNTEGDVVGVTLVARDLRPERALSVEVQRRRRAEEDLQVEQEDAHVLLESVSEAIVSTDGEGRISRLNGPAAALAGRGGAAAIGRPFLDVFPLVCECGARSGEDLVARSLTAGQTAVRAVTRVGPAPGRDAERADERPAGLTDERPDERIVEWSAAPLHEPGGAIRGCVLVGRDVTESRRVDQELQRVARLESIGTLAGGIAHDFNNLLVGVVGNLAMARLELVRADGPVAERLDVAERSAERAAGLARQLLTFSHGGAPLRRALALPGPIAEWAGFALSGSPVRLELRLAENLRPVFADEGQLHQVVQNLVLNARQAMPGGGALVVAGENVAHGVCPALRPQPHGYVQLTFTDEGCGIPADALSRVFDPFFTTRAGGTGLGLATTFSIVQRHEGHVAVESTPGCGAEFRVWLPATSAVPAPAPARAAPSTASGRVLVMDDEALVLEVAAVMLRRLGYTVTAVADGEAALAAVDAAAARGEPFVLALLDLTVVEGLGGLETARRLRAAHPDLPLVVSSGYASGSVLSEFRAHGFASALPKPYRPEDLAAALAEALCAPPPVDPTPQPRRAIGETVKG